MVVQVSKILETQSIVEEKGDARVGVSAVLSTKKKKYGVKNYDAHASA